MLAYIELLYFESVVTCISDVLWQLSTYVVVVAEMSTVYLHL